MKKMLTYGNQLISDEEILSVTEVLKNKAIFRYASGFSMPKDIESDLAVFLKTQHALVLVNCTAAIKSALMSLYPKPGDYVLIPGITFIATANAALSCGLIPILVDTDDTGHMCPVSLKETINLLDEKPLAVIAVHLDGSSCQIETIKSICKGYEISLIEDVAQSFGVKRNGKALGTYGDFGCFSFQQNKVISTGEGGALISDNTELFYRAQQYGDFGSSRSSVG